MYTLAIITAIGTLAAALCGVPLNGPIVIPALLVAAAAVIIGVRRAGAGR